MAEVEVRLYRKTAIMDADSSRGKTHTAQVHVGATEKLGLHHVGTGQRVWMVTKDLGGTWHVLSNNVPTMSMIGV